MKIVHIGLPKCASSALQTNVFSQLSNHKYVGPAHLSNVSGEIKIKDPDAYTRLHDSIVSAVCSENEPAGRLINQDIKALLFKETDFVFTSEWITGIRYSPSAYRQNIDRLAKLIGKNCIAVLVVRPHLELIVSMYRDNPTSLLTKEPCNTFEDFYFHFVRTVRNASSIYEEIYSACASRFQDVIVLNVAELSEEKTLVEFYKLIGERMSADLNRKENSGISKSQFVYMHVVRRFKFLTGFLPQKVLVTVHHFLMMVLASSRKYDVKVSQAVKKDSSIRFENDWQFILATFTKWSGNN